MRIWLFRKFHGKLASSGCHHTRADKMTTFGKSFASRGYFIRNVLNLFPLLMKASSLDVHCAQNRAVYKNLCDIPSTKAVKSKTFISLRWNEPNRKCEILIDDIKLPSRHLFKAMSAGSAVCNLHKCAHHPQPRYTTGKKKIKWIVLCSGETTVTTSARKGRGEGRGW